jgi:glycerophosphoryl diester phosphodiesterase
VTLVIGHKGAPTRAPENSARSFAAARVAGADGVEVDVRRAHGGKLVVWHDPVLPDGRVLLDTPWSELSNDLDDLETVLDAAAGVDLVNIEIKNWPDDPDYDPIFGIVDAIVDVLMSRSVAERQRFLVSSFDLSTLRRARELLSDVAPRIDTGWILWGVNDIDKALARVADGGHVSLHPHHSAVTPELVQRAHERGLAVHGWTCNDLDRICWLAGIGIDGIFTDVPAEAKHALNSR